MIDAWAARWRIPPEAIRDLQQNYLGMIDALGTMPPELAGFSEAAVSAQVRLMASKLGWRTWRNNVGMLMNDVGVPIRFGLANDSSKMNKMIKSSDQIGIRPLLITPAHVGLTIGQFVSLEIKHGSWRYTGSDREIAQARWMGLVRSMGGIAMFVTEPKQLTMCQDGTLR